MDITFRTDELTVFEAHTAAMIEQDPGAANALVSMVDFISKRAVLPAEADVATEVNALCMAILMQPVSEVYRLFHAASLAARAATATALERVQSEMTKENTALAVGSDSNDNTDSLFDEAAQNGLSM